MQRERLESETITAQQLDIRKINEHICYERMVGVVYGLVKPGEIITPELATEYNLRILILGNRNLRADNFDFKRRDKNPLGSVKYPGKSAHIDFLQVDNCTKEDAERAVQLVFNHNMDRRDAIYAADISMIDQIGYRTYFAPLREYPLHLRLVHTNTINGGEVPTHAKQKLRDIFKRVYPPQK